MQSDTSLFLTGLGIGIGIAVIGGAVDFWLSRRKNNPQTNRLPGCMLYVAGTLGLIGIIALVVSVILSGSIGPAIILGAGILGGFYAGFALLMLLYLVAGRFWPNVGG